MTTPKIQAMIKRQQERKNWFREELERIAEEVPLSYEQQGQIHQLIREHDWLSVRGNDYIPSEAMAKGWLERFRWIRQRLKRVVEEPSDGVIDLMKTGIADTIKNRIDEVVCDGNELEKWSVY